MKNKGEMLQKYLFKFWESRFYEKIEDRTSIIYSNIQQLYKHPMLS